MEIKKEDDDEDLPGKWWPVNQGCLSHCHWIKEPQQHKSQDLPLPLSPFLPLSSPARLSLSPFLSLSLPPPSPSLDTDSGTSVNYQSRSPPLLLLPLRSYASGLHSITGGGGKAQEDNSVLWKLSVCGAMRRRRRCPFTLQRALELHPLTSHQSRPAMRALCIRLVYFGITNQTLSRCAGREERKGFGCLKMSGMQKGKC